MTHRCSSNSKPGDFFKERKVKSGKKFGLNEDKLNKAGFKLVLVLFVAW